MGEKTKNLTIIKHSLRFFPSKRTLTTTIHHQLSTTHETLHCLSNSTTKLRDINFTKNLSPKSNHHNYTKENHTPSTLINTLSIKLPLEGIEKLREFNGLRPYYSKNQGTAEPL